MFWNKTKNRKPVAVRSSKLRLEILEDRRLLSAVDWNAPGKTSEVCDVASAVFNETIELPIVSSGTNKLVVTTNVDELNGNGLDAATSDANGLSLREAIYYADAGTTITFKESLKGTTIKLDGKELEITRSLTIDASALYDATTNTPGITLDASGYSRVMGVSFADANPTKSSLELVGLTLRGGNAEDGGGLFISGGTVTATNVKISGNTATNTGGGVYVNKPGTFIATNVKISGNTAYDGGGVCTNYSTVDINESTISENEAELGGGLYLNNTTATFKKTTIAENDVSRGSVGYGGGLYTNDSTVEIEGSTISENKAKLGGGGLCACRSTVTIKSSTTETRDSTISDNSACKGGAIFLNDSSLTMTDTILDKNKSEKGSAIYKGSLEQKIKTNGILCCTADALSEKNEATLVRVCIVDNQAVDGAVYVESGATLTATNVTIAGNTASGKGGGLYAENDATITLENSIVAENKIGGDDEEEELYADVYNDGTIDAYYVLSSFIEWSEGEGFFEYDPTLPLFKDAENGDYSLTADSQALDKGNDKYLEELAEEFDIDWQIAFAAIDLGAFEFFNGLTSLSISGRLEVGQTLIATPYADEDKVTEATYQWYRDGEEIDGANDATYKVTFADFGRSLSVVAIGIGTEGYLGIVEAEAGVVSRTQLTINPTLAEFTKALEIIDDDGTISFVESSKARTITIRSTINVSKALTIDGSAANVTFNGAGKRIFNVESTGSLTIRNLTLIGGYAKYGGAIYNAKVGKNAGKITLNAETVDFASSKAFKGAAIANYGLLSFDSNDDSTSWTTTRCYDDETVNRTTSQRPTPTSALRAEAFQSLFAEPNSFDVTEVDDFAIDSLTQEEEELNAVWLNELDLP